MDLQLSARMVLTMFLLGAVYAVFLIVLATVFHVGWYFLIVIAALIMGIQYFFTDKIAMASMGARLVDEQQVPQLHAIITRLAQQANLPKPKVAMIQTSLPNAFATGRNAKNAVVCVTTGLMDRLDTPELEAVLAHELTHIINHDMVVMTIATFLSMVASLIVNSLMWGGLYGGYGRRGRDNSGSAIMVVYLVSLLVYAISFVLIRALSRYREYAADRGSALITGAPSHLASALMKIEGAINSGRIPQQDLRRSQAVSALFIFPAIKRDSAAEIFSTHPSLAHRIAKLQAMQSRMEHPS